MRLNFNTTRFGSDSIGKVGSLTKMEKSNEPSMRRDSHG